VNEFNINRPPARWEWRVFQPTPFPMDMLPSDLEYVRSVESEEQYLVGEDVGNNLKIRFSMVDLKQLQTVTRDGVQLWDLMYKAEFPVLNPDIQALIKLLPAFEGLKELESIDHQKFIAYATEKAGFQLVRVVKDRNVYRHGTTGFDLVRATMNGRTFFSASCEDPDQQKVRGWAQSMEFEPDTNTSYIQAIHNYDLLKGN